jgi:hypothetical protein
MYWLEDLPPCRPIWLMRATGVLWALIVIWGTVVYFTGMVSIPVYVG